ncbi:MAG: LuxR C-terminal-related transcriptional regulator [Acidimicrobiia bacterium]|nr:LuxR C-terminal-related transcriptional regulator [Acidimicrobiia bacterium]
MLVTHARTGSSARRSLSRQRIASIADQLHLSVRTVETHLHKIYRKLGIWGRSQLAAPLSNPDPA